MQFGGRAAFEHHTHILDRDLGLDHTVFIFRGIVCPSSCRELADGLLSVTKTRQQYRRIYPEEDVRREKTLRKMMRVSGQLALAHGEAWALTPPMCSKRTITDYYGQLRPAPLTRMRATDRSANEIGQIGHTHLRAIIEQQISASSKNPPVHNICASAESALKISATL